MKRKRFEEVESEPPKKKMKTFDENKEIFFILQKANEIFQRPKQVKERKVKLIPPMKVVQRRKRTPQNHHREEFQNQRLHEES